MAKKTPEEKAAKAAKAGRRRRRRAGHEKQQAAKAAGPASEVNADGRETEHAVPRMKDSIPRGRRARADGEARPQESAPGAAPE